MKLQPNNVKAEYINQPEDYTIIYLELLEAPTLVYGSLRGKTHKGVAFKNTATMREVANNMLLFADAIDILKAK